MNVSLEIQHRYLHDARFHYVVDALRQLVPVYDWTGDDLKAAADLATELAEDDKRRRSAGEGTMTDATKGRGAHGPGESEPGGTR